MSVGVTGLRVGVGPGKAPYIHAGRHGLYFRKSLTSGHGSAGAASPSTTAVTEMVRADVYDADQIFYSTPVFSSDLPAISPWWILLPPVYLVLILLHRGRDRRALDYVNGFLAGLSSASDDNLPASPPPDLPLEYLAWAHEAVYQGALARVFSDNLVSRDELSLLARIEHLPGLRPDRLADIKSDWFRAAYMEAVADHELSVEEEKKLDAIRESLGVSSAAISEEATTIERLKKSREAGAGALVAIEYDFPLAKDEVCYFQAPGRLLVKKVLAGHQRQYVMHKQTGLVAKKEGTLLITSSRLLLVGDGSLSIPFGKILDLEVDMDMNLITITRSDRKNPVYLSTPESLSAGALLDRLVRAQGD